MLLHTNIITSCKGATDKKDIREHLRAICFDFDAESNKLTIVGTNAQIAIINTVEIKGDIDVAFCKKHFTDNQAYFFNDGVLDSKKPFTEFTEIDGKLVCNGIILNKLDQTYPNWRAIIPTKNLKQATVWCGFDPDLVKQIDKALGWKNKIMCKMPVVNGDNDRNEERLAPHRWDLHEFDFCDTIVLCMPMRLD